jgi:hypothetical protein
MVSPAAALLTAVQLGSAPLITARSDVCRGNDNYFLPPQMPSSAYEASTVHPSTGRVPLLNEVTTAKEVPQGLYDSCGDDDNAKLVASLKNQGNWSLALEAERTILQQIRDSNKKKLRQQPRLDATSPATAKGEKNSASSVTKAASVAAAHDGGSAGDNDDDDIAELESLLNLARIELELGTATSVRDAARHCAAARARAEPPPPQQQTPPRSPANARRHRLALRADSLAAEVALAQGALRRAEELAAATLAAQTEPYHSTSGNAAGAVTHYIADAYTHCNNDDGLATLRVQARACMLLGAEDEARARATQRRDALARRFGAAHVRTLQAELDVAEVALRRPALELEQLRCAFRVLSSNSSSSSHHGGGAAAAAEQFQPLTTATAARSGVDGAYAKLVAALGPQHALARRALLLKGMAAAAREDLAGAADVLRRAVSLARDAHVGEDAGGGAGGGGGGGGDKHPLAQEAKVQLARVLMRSGSTASRVDEVRALLRGAADVYRRAYGPDSYWTCHAELLLGCVAFATCSTAPITPILPAAYPLGGFGALGGTGGTGGTGGVGGVGGSSSSGGDAVSAVTNPLDAMEQKWAAALSHMRRALRGLEPQLGGAHPLVQQARKWAGLLAQTVQRLEAQRLTRQRMDSVLRSSTLAMSSVLDTQRQRIQDLGQWRRYGGAGGTGGEGRGRSGFEGESSEENQPSGAFQKYPWLR